MTKKDIIKKAIEAIYEGLYAGTDEKFEDILSSLMTLMLRQDVEAEMLISGAVIALSVEYEVPVEDIDNFDVIEAIREFY